MLINRNWSSPLRGQLSPKYNQNTTCCVLKCPLPQQSTITAYSTLVPEKVQTANKFYSKQELSSVETLALLLLEGVCGTNTDSCAQQRFKIPGQDVDKSCILFAGDPDEYIRSSRRAPGQKHRAFFLVLSFGLKIIGRQREHCYQSKLSPTCDCSTQELKVEESHWVPGQPGLPRKNLPFK